MARKALPPRGRKGKALVPPMKGAPAAGPPRPVRGTVPVFAMGGPPGRRSGPPPPRRGAPPRMTPTVRQPPAGAETPRAERLEAAAPPPSSRAPAMQQRGAPATMARLRRGKVAF